MAKEGGDVELIAMLDLDKAFREDNLEKVKHILNTNKFININASLIIDDISSPLLHIAIVVSKNIKIIEELIKFGADINIYDSYKNTALSLSIISNKNDFATLFINMGANVNQLYNNKFSPLHCAVLKSNSEIAIKLINAGADINYIHPYPIKSNKILNNIDFNLSTMRKKDKPSSEDIKWLKKMIDNSKYIYIKYSILMYAIIYENIEIITALINAGVNINYKNNIGHTALYLALESNERRCVLNILLKCKSIKYDICDNKSKIKYYYNNYYNKICNVCKIDCKIMRCSSCNIVGYCSKKCQKQDWKQHKISCEFFANLRIPEGLY